MEKNHMFRLFTGIGLPLRLRQQLHVLQEGIAGVGAGTRLTRPEDFHITLSFIGNVEAATAEDIDEALSGIRARRFSLTLQGTGYSSGANGSHHLQAGVERSEALRRLKEKIDRDFEKHQLPFKKRSKYTPHVTIARIKDIHWHEFKERKRYTKEQQKILHDIINKYEHQEFGSFTVDHFSLIASAPTEHGHVYSELAQFPLA